MTDLNELKLWLEGTEPTQVNFRLKKENLASLSEMVTQYAATPGGKSASLVWSNIRKEREMATRIINEKAAKDLAREKLVAAVRAHFLKNGGTEAGWKARQTAILEEYATSGRAEEILRNAGQERRAKAARTF